MALPSARGARYEDAPAPDTADGDDDEGTAPRLQDVRRRNVRDIAMLALGLASLGIIVYDFWVGAAQPEEERRLLEAIDLGIVGVFVVEYGWRLSKAERKARFVARHWFDLLGMVPLAATNIPIFRAFRLVRVALVAARLLRMWSFVTGEKSAQRVLNRYRDALVEEVTDRVMLRGLAMAEGVVVQGAYVRALGQTLEAQREPLARAAEDAAKANDLGRWFAMVPGFDAAVRTAALTSVDTVSAYLRSPEVQRAFEAALRDILEEARAELQRKQWREARAALGTGSGPAAGPTPPGTKGL